MTTYTSRVDIDVRSVDKAVAPQAASNSDTYVIDHLIETIGASRGVSVEKTETPGSFVAKVEATDDADADQRLNDTFKPRRVDGIEYAISWTLPGSAEHGRYL